jgi:hypothetical protein
MKIEGEIPTPQFPFDKPHHHEKRGGSSGNVSWRIVATTLAVIAWGLTMQEIEKTHSEMDSMSARLQKVEQGVAYIEGYVKVNQADAGHDLLTNRVVVVGFESHGP